MLQTAGYIWAVSGNRLFITAVDYAEYPPMPGAVVIVGSIMLLVGLAPYAQAKGRTRWWGLMGFFSIFGVLVLALLPDLSPSDDPAGGKPHPMARISVYLGAAAIIPLLGVLFGVLGVVIGGVALAMRKSNPALGGRKAAITGITLGALLVFLQGGAMLAMWLSQL